MSFFIQKKNMYLHQYLFLNFLYSTIISIIFFSLNKYSLYKISVDLIFFKTHQLNSYLLCAFLYIIIIMVSATSFIGAPVISIGIIYRILCIISFIFKYYQSLLSFHNIFIIVSNDYWNFNYVCDVFYVNLSFYTKFQINFHTKR